MIYIINKDKVEDRLEGVSTKQRAGTFSEEYNIERLHTTEFDIIDSKILCLH